MFWPFLSGNVLVWYIKHCFRKEDIANEVAAGLWVGRYPLAIKSGDKRFLELIQKDLVCVVDLTVEFPLKTSFVGTAVYHSCPSLDRLMSTPTALAKLAVNLLALRRSSSDGTKQAMYVHCANGHGRSALVAAMVLIMNNECNDFEHAKVVMRENRPGIKWQQHQEAVAKCSLLEAQASVKLVPANE